MQVLIEAGSDVTCLIVADTDSKGLNDESILIGTVSDPGFEKVLGKERTSICLGFVVMFLYPNGMLTCFKTQLYSSLCF